MNIGIAGPIKIRSLKKFLPNLSNKDLKLGLGGTAVNQIIEGLIKAGHKVTVFTLDPKIDSTYILEGNNLKVICGHFRLSIFPKIFDFSRKEFLQIKKMIEQEKGNLDLVNAHWSYEFAIGTILANVPHLITFRDHSQTIFKLTKKPFRLTSMLMDSWVRKNGKAFSYNSTYLKSKIGLSGTVIPNPINESLIKERRTFPGYNSEIDIFHIANGWSPIKNPEAAIEAFTLLRKENKKINLHLIGIGYEEGSIDFNKVRKKYNLEGIYFRGFIEHDKLMDMMKSCDLLLHTSKEESFGNNLIEAMANGIPVIAGESSGAVPWVLDDGNTGILIDINDPFQIAQSIRKLISNKDLYENLSLKGIKNVTDRFTLEVVSNKYIKEYKRQIQQQVYTR